MNKILIKSPVSQAEKTIAWFYTGRKQPDATSLLTQHDSCIARASKCAKSGDFILVPDNHQHIERDGGTALHYKYSGTATGDKA